MTRGIIRSEVAKTNMTRLRGWCARGRPPVDKVKDAFVAHAATSHAAAKEEYCRRYLDAGARLDAEKRGLPT